MIKYLSFCGKNEFLRVKLVGIDTWIKSLAIEYNFLHAYIPVLMGVIELIELCNGSYRKGKKWRKREGKGEEREKRWKDG